MTLTLHVFQKIRTHSETQSQRTSRRLHKCMCVCMCVCLRAYILPLYSRHRANCDTHFGVLAFTASQNSGDSSSSAELRPILRRSSVTVQGRNAGTGVHWETGVHAGEGVVSRSYCQCRDPVWSFPSFRCSFSAPNHPRNSSTDAPCRRHVRATNLQIHFPSPTRTHTCLPPVHSALMWAAFFVHNETYHQPGHNV